MNVVSIDSLEVSQGRWIALAVETDSDTLVACTSSEKSESEAKRSLRGTLLRLRRINVIEDPVKSLATSSIANRLAKLLDGDGQPFSLDEISIKNWSSARLRVSKRLLEVPRGKVISYGYLAQQTNSSPRGVGSIMRSNPVPWAIPCHRVIHSDGRLGKLGGTIRGTKEKARILRAEGVLFDSEVTVNPKSMVR